jgi:peptidoglycan/LPS O-acetylase OafA/YrhL
MTQADTSAQGGLEQVAGPDRVASLTGIRAVAATLVVATHAAYTTGKYSHGYFGLLCSRMELGVPIFFVLSGFLLFRPWVKSVATGGPEPSVGRYARHRVRRIMPAYVITVLTAYVLYHFRTAGPNWGHTWIGLLRNLTLTQIYAFNYIGSYVHQGLTQMWSLAVEASFYVALPLLAYLLIVVLCRRKWRPNLLLCGIAGLALISPAWLVWAHLCTPIIHGARIWLPTYLIWFLAGMSLTVLQRMGVRCYGFVALPLAVICYLIAATPIAGDPTTSPLGLSQALFKAVLYAVISALALAPVALGNEGLYCRLLASRPMVWLGEISYEIFLVHLITMEFAMVYIMKDHVYTGSMAGLFVVTMVVTTPLAWLLHRFTRVRG